MAQCSLCEKPATEKGGASGQVDLCSEHKKIDEANILIVAPIPNKKKDEKNS